MGTPLILTRPHEQSAQFWGQVAATCPGRFIPILTPLMEIRAEETSLDIDGAQALLFTSRNAVAQFAARSDRRDIPALCVGHATARVAQDHGFIAQSADGDAAALATLVAQSHVPDGGHFIHFRGAHSAGNLVDALLGEGIPTEERVIYDQRALPLTDSARSALEQSPCIIPLFSPRSARLLVEQLQGLTPARHQIIAISEAVATEATRVPGSTITVAQHPSATAMLAAIASL